MTPQKIDVLRFLELSEVIPVADVRSPSEYRSGHIPGAVNIPLFDDREREAVGTIYKKKGRLPAILEGLKNSGPALQTKLEHALKIAKNQQLLIHCWRGGMRSEAMAWLFSLGDIEVKVLEGGYKSYRRHILGSLDEKRKIIVLGGMTGIGKTHIIRHLRLLGQQVIDLENLANHKGSAFGALGQQAQPSSEHFANILYTFLNKLNRNLPLWVEDESRSIGSVFVPDGFYLNMQDAPSIVLVMDIKIRLPRLMNEYSAFPKEFLKASVLKISRRLGGEMTSEVIEAIEKEEFSKAIEFVLHYYDKAYMFGLNKKKRSNIIYVNTDTDDIEANALKVLDAAGKIKWD
jgi:tRNA 2-selenouridine synthase